MFIAQQFVFCVIITIIDDSRKQTIQSFQSSQQQKYINDYYLSWKSFI